MNSCRQRDVTSCACIQSQLHKLWEFNQIVTIVIQIHTKEIRSTKGKSPGSQKSMGFIPFVAEIWHWGEKHSKFNPCERRKDLLRFTVWGPWNSILWFMGNSAKSCLYISVWTKVTDGLCLSHTVRLSQLTAVVLNDSSVFACCLRALCPVQIVSLPLSVPSSLHSTLLFPGVCLMDWCYYLYLLHPSVFKGGRWLYLSSFSVLKRRPGHCSAPLPLWVKLGGKKQGESLVRIWQTGELIAEITIFLPSLSVYFLL